MRASFCIQILFVIGVLQSCHSANHSRGEKPLADTNYEKVLLDDLVNHKGIYHNKAIQVNGIYLCGFERTVLFPELYIPGTAPPKKTYDWAAAIWVDNKSNIRCDSLNDRMITVKGIFDTTRHGYQSGYIAAIKDAVIIK